MSQAATVVLEGDAARAYCALAARLIDITRPGNQFPDPRLLRHLLWGSSKTWPRAAEARLELVIATGLPSLRSLEQLSALRATAVEFFEQHKARPTPDAKAFLTALAGAPLPALRSTRGRLVSRARGGRRFQVVHDRYAGELGLPVRFTFHLTDEKQRYLTANKDGQAKVSAQLEKALELACEGGAEEAFWGLASLPGAEVAEVVRGQLGPLEAPGIAKNAAAPLAGFLASAKGGGAVLHSVIERAAQDVAADGCRDPFGALLTGQNAERRRAGLNYRVFRERKLACTEALHEPLSRHLVALGQPLVVRSR